MAEHCIYTVSRFTTYVSWLWHIAPMSAGVPRAGCIIVGLGTTTLQSRKALALGIGAEMIQPWSETNTN